MKITKSQLKQLVEKELDNFLKEDLNRGEMLAIKPLLIKEKHFSIK